jgi:hypothetical protein
LDYSLDIESQIHTKIQKFLLVHLQKKTFMAKIIVGKGLNSQNFIQGKNPLRFYTENYLAQLNINFKDTDFTWDLSPTILLWW